MNGLYMAGSKIGLDYKMALPLLGLLGILKNVPKLFKAVKGGDGGLISKALSIAKAVTGIGDEKGAVEAIKSDPELSYKYEMALLADKHIPDRLNLENTQGARDAYKIHNVQADKIAEKIMNYNIIVAFLLVIINVASVVMLDDKTLIAIISSSTSGFAAGLMAERQNVVNFFFGSSMGSKQKDSK